MSDTGDLYKALKADRQSVADIQCQHAADTWRDARDLARHHGWDLWRSGDQYRLIGPHGEVYHLYPSNCHIYHPKIKPGAYLRFAGVAWTLAEVVAKAVEQTT